MRERETSRLTPNGLVPAIIRMELTFNEMDEADEGEDGGKGKFETHSFESLLGISVEN